MAITKLMNIKSSPGGSSRHLYNAIKYILNPAKTEGGYLAGGNADTDYLDAYHIMMDTKRLFEKTDKRQGYHFVLSFKSGETDKDTAYRIVEEFCQEYLGDDYDTVFAVHDDKEHMHGHIIFNSVSRVDGYKYHYQKGDWERYIQPVTNRLCEKYGLSPLEFSYERKGKSYAEWNAKKNGTADWGLIIRQDIDYAIGTSFTYEDFLTEMKKMGYQLLRGGTLQGHGEYLTFLPPGRDRGRRSNRLGRGYSVADIRQRIKNREQCSSIPRTPKVETARMGGNYLSEKMKMSVYQTQRVRQMRQIRNYHRYQNPYDPRAAQFRKSYLEIQKIYQDCCFLFQNNIRSESQFQRKKDELSEREKILRNERYTAKQEDPLERIREEYHMLEKKLAEIPEDDDSWEEIEDRLLEITDQYPEALISRVKPGIEPVQNQLDILREDKRRVRHIEKMKQLEMYIAPGIERRKTYSYGGKERTAPTR